MRGPVPNQFPRRESPYRIALVGESPGADECRMGAPFVGAAGFTLNNALSAVGLDREACFIGNVCQHRPSATANDFHLLAWEGEEVQAGIAALLQDLGTFRPNLVVCLGNVPLHLFHNGNVAPGRTKTGYQWPSSVTKWRGSLFLAHQALLPPIPPASVCPDNPPATWPRWKCLSTWHPAYVNRVWVKMFDLRHDLRRARDEGGTAQLTLPTVRMEFGPDSKATV